MLQGENQSTLGTLRLANKQNADDADRACCARAAQITQSGQLVVIT